MQKPKLFKEPLKFFNIQKLIDGSFCHKNSAVNSLRNNLIQSLIISARNETVMDSIYLVQSF